MPSRTSSFPSAPSMVSVATTTSASSSTPLRHTPSSSPSPSSSQKDYSAAFGALQTQYGWGPVMSVPVQSTQVAVAHERKKAAKEKKETENANADAKRKEEARSQPKDYESAFGALSSKMGFGGRWPASASQRKQ
ncbi:hypothetical protein K466DRAFT_590768 [Polyporus arcularius HHB13444]|uniref:Uncharacterized protein n=1 Tax=Polyporus arcularius HHB13444 TaxID=1314778 RepID=A0A5C3NXZ5_9APHY|nr:hypothetical protein K466DRAFT_590768 [Polyporus arcularius HHB13444]